MIPLHFVIADLRRMWVGAAVVVVLIALATALGISVGLEERALRLGSARAAERFDLVIGAASSETQLVLSAVFLQPAPLPLMSGEVLQRLAADPRIAYAAPVGFGDSFEGLPIVGTIAEMATNAGRAPLAEGRIFAKLGEAVVGADTRLSLGDIIKPMHGLPEEGGHTHTELAYEVVGRMAPTGTPWDRAILVPIEAVWRIHGLAGHPHEAAEGEEHEGEAAASEPAHLGPPWGEASPGVPAVVVKPRSVVDAYRLRQEYRRDTTVGVFPAEVLTRLYATLGDAQAFLTAIAIGTQALVGAAIVLVSVIHLSQRRRQIGALRALGAPRLAIFGLVWSELLALVGLGVATGTGIGFLGAKAIAGAITRQTGIVLPVALTGSDLVFAGLLLAVAAVMAILPAWLAYRQPVVEALRS